MTKILEEYNKDLVKKIELELLAGALLFVQSFTTQAADHIGQVEALRKVKGKGKKVFSRAPPAKTGYLAGGEQALPLQLWIQGDIRSECSQEPTEMTINLMLY